MKCVKCNNEINDNSKFCEYCGYKVESNINISNNQIYNTNNNYMDNTNINNTVVSNQTINNNLNNDFKKLDGAINLFRSVNCIGKQNLVFLAYKDPLSWKAVSLMVAGDSVLSMINDNFYSSYNYDSSNETVHRLGIEAFSALLINVTEHGIGMIPMVQYFNNKIAEFTTTSRFLKPNINEYIFINNDNIESIEIKKIAGIFKNKNKVVIKIKGDIVFNLLVMAKEQLVPYQEDNFRFFVNNYSNKNNY